MVNQGLFPMCTPKLKKKVKKFHFLLGILWKNRQMQIACKHIHSIHFMHKQYNFFDHGKLRH